MEYLLLLIQIVLQTQWQISTLHLLSNLPESNSLQVLFFFSFRQITLQFLIIVLSHYILRMVTLFYMGVAQIFISDTFTNYVLE